MTALQQFTDEVLKAERRGLQGPFRAYMSPGLIEALRSELLPTDQRYVWHNPNPLPTSESKVPSDYRGEHFGVAVYEDPTEAGIRIEAVALP